MPTFMKITKDKCINLDKLVCFHLLRWSEEHVEFYLENGSSHHMEFKSKKEALDAISIIEKDFSIRTMEER